ncbi:MAG: protease, partial [Planctomycetota bacterium]
MRILPYSLIVILNFCLIGHSLAQGTRLLRDPDVGPETIAFVHANDIWLAPREGGDAFRLTSGEGAETGPSFSPDGKWIAFTGQYNGNADVFVVPAKGGMPKQLTWHPGADVVQGWTPDGKIMFQSSRHGQPTKRSRFYTVSMDGGLPIALELPQANQGEMSQDGNLIAYEEIRSWDKEWRNYRGGQAQPIGIVSTKTWNRTTTPWEGERHLEPVWLDGILYYLSERDYAANVWSYDPQTKQDKQLTRHADFDCKSMGAGFGMVVYEQGGYLHHLDIDTGESETIEINVARDLNWARPRWQDVSGGQLTNARLSPTGKRALFESRGELFTVPLDKGSWRNITNSPGVADRHAVWSPDGKQIAWFSDEGGEYGFIISDQKGNQKKRTKIDDPTFFFIPQWSPDGKKLAFTDTDYRIWVLDVESEQLTHVDTDRYAHPQRSMNPVWSPDSNWLAYSRRRETQLRTIVLYDVAGDKKHELTDGMADSISPVWDESGKYLYFLASVNFGLNIGWLDMTSYDRPITRTLYVAILDSEESSPFLPVSDEEEIKEDKKDDQDSQTERKQKPESETDAKPESESEAIDQDEKKPDGETSDAEKDSEATKKNDDVLKIDFQDIHLRILSAPGMRTANYLGLENGPKGQVFVFESKDGQPNVLHKYSVKDQKAKEFAEGVTSAAESHDRKK